MKVSYSLIFDRKKEITKKNHEKGLIQIQVYLNGRRRYFSTKIYVTPKEWDKKKLNVKDAYLAKLLRDRIAEFEQYEVEFRALHKTFKLSDFVKFTHPEEEKPTQTIITFTDFYKQQLEKEILLRKVTHTNQTNTFKKLQEFKAIISFDDLSYNFIQDFEIFLRQTKKLRTNTIEKYHRHLRKYINLAIKQDLFAENKNPYKHFKLKVEETDTIFLLPEETVRIEQLEFPEEIKNYQFLEKARDMFLFSCYTGLRFSDCYALTNDNFSESNEGLILKFRAMKTEKIAIRPLYLLFDGKPQEIARKYMPTEANKKLFKGMTNPKVNRLLKVIAEMAKVHRGLYFKASRDTFGTTLYMLSGDAKLVQKQLQHSKGQQTDKYVHFVEQIQNEGLQKIFKPSNKGTNDGGTID